MNRKNNISVFVYLCVLYQKEVPVLISSLFSVWSVLVYIKVIILYTFFHIETLIVIRCKFAQNPPLDITS